LSWPSREALCAGAGCRSSMVREVLRYILSSPRICWFWSIRTETPVHYKTRGRLEGNSERGIAPTICKSACDWFEPALWCKDPSSYRTVQAELLPQGSWKRYAQKRCSAVCDDFLERISD
jgi:hypothetical protein